MLVLGHLSTPRPISPAQPATSPHPISRSPASHPDTVGPLLCPVSFPRKNDVWAPPVSLTSHSTYIGTECLSHRRVGHTRQRPARAHALSRAPAGGTPTQVRHLPSDKAEVVTKQRDHSRWDWSLARSDSTRIRLSLYLIKLTIRDPISGYVDNLKPPSSLGHEVHAEGDFCAAVMVPQFHGCPVHVAWSGMNASSCANLLRCHQVDRATIADSIVRWRQGSTADPPPPWAGIFHSLIPRYGATTSFDVFYSLQSAKPRGRLHRGSPIMPSPPNHGRDGWAAPPWVVWE
jgi:hypothetical protein